MQAITLIWAELTNPLVCGNLWLSSASVGLRELSLIHPCGLQWDSRSLMYCVSYQEANLGCFTCNHRVQSVTKVGKPQSTDLPNPWETWIKLLVQSPNQHGRDRQVHRHEPAFTGKNYTRRHRSVSCRVRGKQADKSLPSGNPSFLHSISN